MNIVILMSLNYYDLFLISHTFGLTVLVLGVGPPGCFCLEKIKISSPEDGILLSYDVSPRPSLRRLPVAIMNLYRIVAFRMTVTFFDSFSINFAEVFVAAAYVAILFMWTFMNSQ